MQVHTSRKVQATGRTKGDVEGGKGADGKGDERVCATLSPREEKRGRSEQRASGETETEEIRAPGVCALFRVSAREKERERGI